MIGLLIENVRQRWRDWRARPRVFYVSLRRFKRDHYRGGYWQ